jgi:hypothetical protein
MRLRPLLTVLGLIIASLASATTVADASIVRTRTLPPPLEAVAASCPGGATGGSVAVVASPTGIPYGYGIGSLLLRQGDADDVVGISRPLDPLSSLSKVSVSMYDADEYGTAWSDASTWIEVRATNGSGTFHLLWPLDLLGHSSSWHSDWVYANSEGHVFREDDGGWVPVGDGTASLQEFVAQYGDGAGVLQVVRAPCYAGLATGNPGWTPPSGLGTDTYLDAVTITLGDPNPPTYDFEEHIVRASMSTTRLEITAGESTKLGTGLTRDSAPYTGQKVELWKRSYQASDWVMVGTATTNSKGRAGLAVKPQHETQYEWRYPPARIKSPTLRLAVATKVTISVEDSTLHPGDKVLVKGKISPLNDYAVPTLWRRTDSGDVKLTWTNMSGGGAFRIEKILKDKGTYRLFVTIPASRGNETGRSAIKKVTVS